jgi:hypothetical protein
VQVVAKGPHHHLAGVEPYPKLHSQAMRPPHRLTVAANSLLHGQGRIARAHGMIFMGNGRAEQGHNPVAHHLVHRALEAVHGVHHQLNNRVQELLRGLGIEPLDQPGGVLEVGEEDGDLLALAFQSSFGGEDFLGQIARGVAQRGWGRHSRRRWGLRRERGAALRTELGAGEHVRPALGAAGPQGAITLDAELRPVRGVSLTARAVHRKALGHGHASGSGVSGRESRRPCSPWIRWCVSTRERARCQAKSTRGRRPLR